MANEDLIRSGFFNSEVDAEGNYDRMYDSNDFSTYFDGLLSRFGVFKNYGEEFKMEMATSNRSLTIHKGKALIDGRWVTIPSVYLLDIPEPPIDNRYRWDSIVLEYSQENREILPKIIQGNIVDTADIYISSSNRPLPRGYDATTKTWTPEKALGVYQITLGYILNGGSQTQLVDNRGNETCPYIANIVPKNDDMEVYLSWYKSQFEKFFDEVQLDKNWNTNISYCRGSVNATYNPAIVRLDGYKYSEDDFIVVYLNGRRLNPDEYSIKYSDFITHTNAVVTLLNTAIQSPLSETNTIAIDVIKGQPVSFADGSNIKY